MIFPLTENFEHPVTATIALLNQLKVKVTASTVNETLQNHPDYPSLLSISDSLKKWHIANVAFKVSDTSKVSDTYDYDKLKEIPLPFLTFINKNGGEFITVTQINNETITYADNTKSKALQKPVDEFVKEWKGIVLLAVANEQSGEKNYRKNKRGENIRSLKIPALLFTGLIIATLSALSFFNQNLQENKIFIDYSILLVLKLAGIFSTSLLLWYEVDKANPALQKICTGIKNTNCNAILGSRQAKIFSWLSWSEVGFFYFTGTFLLLLFGINQSSYLSTLQLIQLLNLTALPYIFFSVYYQWRIAKQWCVLCLSVQALLLLEFMTSISADTLQSLFLTSQLFNFSTVSTFIASFILPIIFWYLLKPSLLNAQEGKRNKRELARIKYNPEIFDALLTKQKRIEHSTEGLGITLGDSEAKNTLIKVCNPYCGPCAKAHTHIEALLNDNNDVNVQIIFKVTNTEKVS
jgi:uncharacterized membrane protein